MEVLLIKELIGLTPDAFMLIMSFAVVYNMKKLSDLIKTVNKINLKVEILEATKELKK